MAESSIPVDLFNPGQVFACLGFLEAAEVLLGDAEGGFDWSEKANVRFHLRARGNDNPVRAVLRFLAEAEVRRCLPSGYDFLNVAGSGSEEPGEDDDGSSPVIDDIDRLDYFPAKEPDLNALPVRLRTASQEVPVTHWADGSARIDFKLYSGNRPAERIVRAMLKGTRAKASKRDPLGAVQTLGVADLCREKLEALVARPFDVLTPIRGSFNFDAHSAWTALGAGFSPHKQATAKNMSGVTASPIVQVLAPIGLEHARPVDHEEQWASYAAWGAIVPPLLARPALAGAPLALPLKRFHFTFAHAGKNRIVTYAQEETSR